MPSNTYPIIAREGWLILFLLACLYLISHLFISDSLAFLFFLVFVVSLYSFRDPSRPIPSIPLAIVSPVHGRIIAIDEVENYWLNRPSKRIRIKMSPWDIYSLRSPTEGKIMDQWSKAMREDMSPQEYAYWIQTDEGDDIVTAIRFDKPKWFYQLYLQSGHRIGQGQRCGYLFFGATVDVYVSTNVKQMVDVGQWIESGSSTLVHLIHNKQASAIEKPKSETGKASS